jgi:hypothetical protein
LCIDRKLKLFLLDTKMTFPEKIQLYLGETRDPLASACAKSGATVSSEIRYRVMQSFRIDEAVKELRRLSSELEGFDDDAVQDLTRIVNILMEERAE